MRRRNAGAGTIIGVAISSAVLVFSITAALIWCTLRRRERKFEGGSIACHVRKPSLSRPPLECKSGTSVLESEQLDHLEKSTYLNLLFSKDSSPPEYAALSNASLPLENCALELPTRGGRTYLTVPSGYRVSHLPELRPS